MCLSLAYVVSQHVPASSWRHQQAVSWLDCCAEPYASSLLQADRVPEARRAAAFGVFSGVCTAGFVASTVAARFLPVSSTCQVCVREHTPAVILGIRWTRVTQLHSSGAAGRRSGSGGDGRVHEGLPPGDGRRSLLVQLRRGGLPAALHSLVLQQRGAVAEAPASSQSAVAVGDGRPSYQQVTSVEPSTV